MELSKKATEQLGFNYNGDFLVVRPSLLGLGDVWLGMNCERDGEHFHAIRLDKGQAKMLAETLLRYADWDTEQEKEQ